MYINGGNKLLHLAIDTSYSGVIIWFCRRNDDLKANNIRKDVHKNLPVRDSAECSVTIENIYLKIVMAFSLRTSNIHTRLAGYHRISCRSIHNTGAREI